jgi:hypothetical protein
MLASMLIDAKNPVGQANPAFALARAPLLISELAVCGL